MEDHERIELLYEAEEDLRNAISKIADAVKGTHHQGNAEAYILPHLRSWLDEDARGGGSSTAQLRNYIERGEDY